VNVLFLDIDGVLNGHEKHPGSPYTTIRPDCVQRLNKVLAKTHCSIVISSAWRYMLLTTKKKYRPPMTLTGFTYMLHTHGLVFSGNGSAIVGFTCADETIAERGGQIIHYVNDNPEVERWAIVDDDPMEMELPHRHRHRLVRTDGRHGLQDRDVRKLVKLLK
jgi:hypothetical protein